MFRNYQKLGIYPWAAARIKPAIKEISRAAGAPDVAMSCYQASGVGLHKTGEACDFQAGNASKYPAAYAEATAVHNAIAKYVLKNWVRLKVRYMAWNGYEYGGNWGGPERKRKQTTNYGGSDPWHQHHVHVDFRPGTINANASIAIGSGLNATKPVTPIDSTTVVDKFSKRYYTARITGTKNKATIGALQRFLTDRGYYSRAVDGVDGSYTWSAYQVFLQNMGYFTSPLSTVQDMTTARATQAWLKNAGHYKGTITSKPTWDKPTWIALQSYLTYAHKGTKTYPVKPAPTPSKSTTTTPTPKPTPKKEPFMALTDAQQKKLIDDVNKTKMAVGRSEKRELAMAQVLGLVVEALGDEGRLRTDTNKTKMAVGRSEEREREMLALLRDIAANTSTEEEEEGNADA